MSFQLKDPVVCRCTNAMLSVKHEDGRADLCDTQILNKTHKVPCPWGVHAIQGDFVDRPVTEFDNGFLLVA
jgi:hypothetical protein